MGLFDKIFKKQNTDNLIGGKHFEALTAYSPVFTNWNGRLYESELVRAAIHARAVHASKLKLDFSDDVKLQSILKLKNRPNSLQSWSQFLYRVSTILDMQNTAFIVPIYESGVQDGFYPVLPSRCEVVEYLDGTFLKYNFLNGQVGVADFNDCMVLTKFQYKDDFFGERNTALNSTMEVINIQNQGISEAVKNSATFRFMARISNFTKPEDLKKEQENFSKSNFSGENGGLLLWPNTYTDIKQIESKPFVVDPAQMNLINTNIFNYFGVNENILQNKAYGDDWNAFYEGMVEPFSIQLSEQFNKVLFTELERNKGLEAFFTANRLMYMSNSEKLNMSAQMADRGVLNRDEIREMWNLPPIPNGEGKAYTIRGEYYLLNEDGTITKKNDDKTKEGKNENN